MTIRTIMFAALLTVTSGAVAQHRPGGETGQGQNMPDSRDARIVDEHLHHGVAAYHGNTKCKVYHRHGHSRRKCWRAR